MLCASSIFAQASRHLWRSSLRVRLSTRLFYSYTSYLSDTNFPVRTFNVVLFILFNLRHVSSMIMFALAAPLTVRSNSILCHCTY